MKRLLLLPVLLCIFTYSYAQQKNNAVEYRRSSLYSMMICHNQEPLSAEIETVFLKIPIPDKFNNHDLSIKIINSPNKTSNENEIREFVEKNNIAQHIVAKWFNRDPETGECNMDLIKERGLYNASSQDIEEALMSHRGFGLLSDAGEHLIGNTFLIVNDIRYNDRQKGAAVGGLIVQSILSGIGGAFGLGEIGNLAAQGMGALISSIKGFGVTVDSYLFRLEWNDDIANTMYSEYYINEGTTDAGKASKFNNSKIFKLKYIGKHSSRSGDISMQGVNSFDPYDMIRKVCERSIDESIVNLQKKYDVFKVAVPIYSVDPEIKAHIGMKEGVTESCRYEVLEQVMNDDGTITLKRVGIVQPIKGKIWDNRYMAMEEKAVGSEHNATTFRVISGSNFYPGMYLKEIRVN